MTNGPSDTPTPNAPLPNAAHPSLAFPKTRRLLRTAEFREVYSKGFKVPGSCFVAFCWQPPASPPPLPEMREDDEDGPKVGFTAPRVLGKAVQRNRMRRRVRETIRRNLWRLGPSWRIVFNLRKAALDAPQSVLDREVLKVIERCGA